MNIKIVLITSILFMNLANAAGGHGPTSLIPSAVNFSILLAGLIFLLKSKASLFFSEKSENISQMIDRAASKAKEAQQMMEDQKKKTSGLEHEIKSMEKEHEVIVKSFEENYLKDIDYRIEKLKEDATQKVEAEKVEMINNLNSNLLDLVISNAKNQIKSNSNLAENAANNIFKGL